MGSKSDMETMEKAGAVLEEAGVQHEIRVMSAHRDPDVVAEYCKNARMRGLRVIIAGAGLSAALPGVAAAHTDLPVIGVPLSSRLTAAGGLDAILSIVQMPPGRAGGVRGARQPAQRRAPRAAHPDGVSLRALSPLDGRYARQVAELADHAPSGRSSARACASRSSGCSCSRPSSTPPRCARSTRASRDADAEEVKEIEARTNHDVKAVEYFLRERVPEDVRELVHFGLTCEDVNNLSYALMLRGAIEEVWRPAAERARRRASRALAESTRAVPLLSRTHGQAGHADDVRQGDGGVRRALAPPARAARRARSTAASSTARSARTARWSSRDPSVDWEDASRRVRRVARPDVGAADDADRAARLDRRALPPARPLQRDPRRLRPRRLGVHLARPGASQRVGRRRGRLVDDAAQGQPDRLREQRGQRGRQHRARRRTWPRRCRCRGCSATSPTRRCCATAASSSATRCSRSAAR